MTVYAITHDGLFRNLLVATYATKAEAESSAFLTRAVDAFVVERDVDLDFPGPRLVALANALLKIKTDKVGVEIDLVNRFATRADGQRRCFGLLEELFANTPPEAAAPPKSDDSAANPETSNEEDDMKKGKKKAAKKVREPKVKKASTKKPAGAKSIVRESSSLGRVLSYGVEGTKTLGQLVALAKLKDNGRNQKSRIKFRVKKVSELVGATYAIDEKDVVSITLPKGKTLDSIFGRA